MNISIPTSSLCGDKPLWYARFRFVNNPSIASDKKLLDGCGLLRQAKGILVLVTQPSGFQLSFQICGHLEFKCNISIHFTEKKYT